jgi:type II secretory pathway component PulF
VKFAYQAFDKSGKSAAASVEAGDIAEATEQLRRQGLYVTQIAPEAAGASNGKAAPSVRGRNLKNLAMFARQLHVLISTGTPLAQALVALERQAKDPAWRKIVGRLKEKVEGGASLSVAMESCPECFDGVARGLIAAGESGGNLNSMLDRLASLIRKEVTVRSAIIGAMIYPLLLSLVAVGVLTVLLTFVLPRFSQLFKSLDTPLPPMTLVLMSVSHAIITYWWMIPVAIGVPVAAVRTWLKMPGSRQTIDRTLLKLPRIGALTRSFCTARMARLLGILSQGKVPLIEALELTRDAIGNTQFATLLDRAREQVAKGEALSSALSASPLISPSVAESLRSGERSGQTAALLLNLADFLDEENEVVIKSLSSVMEPLILIVLGGVIGFIAVSMFLPLFDLTAATQGGH